MKRFKEDPSCMVLIANPGAAAESISLHEQCNHALYLDRTYNAGQFMQSRDRIHRLIEKDKEQQKYFHIFYLSYPGSVDHKVHNALNRKNRLLHESIHICAKRRSTPMCRIRNLGIQMPRGCIGLLQIPDNNQGRTLSL